MAGVTKIQDVTIDEIELEACEIEELDRLAEETRKCGISWEDLKAGLESVSTGSFIRSRSHRFSF